MPVQGQPADVVVRLSTEVSQAMKGAAAPSEAGATMHTLFGDTEERLQARAVTAPSDGGEEPQLHLFYRVEAPDEVLDALAERLVTLPGIDGAYVKPEPQPAVQTDERVRQETEADRSRINRMTPQAVEAPPVTPSYVARQLYRGPAPAGIDADYAWTVSGGRGFNVQVIDCEGAWNLTHEDLLQNQGGVIGNQTTDPDWRNHGTAVAGEIGGDVNTFGVSGICPTLMEGRAAPRSSPSP